MSFAHEFEHDGALYSLSMDDVDRDHVHVSCIVDERTLWTRPCAVLRDAATHGLMLRHRWFVRAGQLFLETEGEHWRGATLHDRRLHRVDRRGLERVPIP